MKEDLLRIKNVIGRKPLRLYTPSTHTDQVISQLNQLSQKVDELSEILKPKTRDSRVKQKTKERIISVINKHKKINATRLGELIGLSRTRSNEYLKELETEGIIRGMFVGRRKFYRLREEYE